MALVLNHPILLHILIKMHGRKVDNLARRMISASVNSLVLENLINYATVACIWSTLCAFYVSAKMKRKYLYGEE